MLRDIKFFWIQRAGRFHIGDEPMMDPKSLDFFRESVEGCSSYLEFGSGGSTVLAARSGKRMVTVESDPYFLKAVVDRIRQEGCLDPSTQRFIHADIGPVGPMGRPLFRLPFNHNKFRRYSSIPWETGACQDPPDLILVDGRFRVACALRSIQALRNRFDTILVDDYSRPEYRVIEQFARLEKMIGRMAVFRPGPPPVASVLETAIRSVELSPR